jgi:GT2 family glycosyltransferase
LKARVVVGIPTQGSVKTKTFLSLVEMHKQYGHRIADIWTPEGTYLHRSREKIMEAAVATDATHVMFIDSDVIFPPDGMERLLRARETVIGASYHLKWQGKQVWAHKPLEAKYGAARDLQEIAPLEKRTDVHEVRGLPTGFMLVDLDAVRSIERPWFDYGPNTEDDWMGEDVFFCEKLRAHGHKILLDPTIRVGHVGDWVY